MRTWARSTGFQRCGCGQCVGAGAIAAGEPMVEIHIGQTRRFRCAASAKRLFAEDPPATLPEAVVAPQPSLPLDNLVRRGHGYVAPRKRGLLPPGWVAASEGAAQALADYKRRGAHEED